MDPLITRRQSFAVLGVVGQVRRGTETPELFAEIWKVFESRQSEIKSLAVGQHYFGVNFSTDTEDVTDYLAGIMVAAHAPVAKGLERRTVSSGRFAVFECPLEAIGETYRYIFTEWLPRATVQLDLSLPVFEEYPENPSQQPIRIHVPVCSDPKASRNTG